MLINKHKNLRHLLRECADKGKLTSAKNKEYEEMQLFWVCALAKQIVEFAPDVLKHTDEIKVMVAGAELESALPQAYMLLNKLLDSKIKASIYLIGPDIITNNMNPDRLSQKYTDSNIRTHLDTCRLEQAIEKYGLPTLLVLNDPGFESHDNEWFIQDNGLKRCLDNGVTVLGGSYGYDEYEVDEFVLKSFGYQLEAFAVNSLTCINGEMREAFGSMQSKRAQQLLLEKGVADSLRTIWKISGKQNEPDGTQYQRYQRGLRLISEVHKYGCEAGYIKQDNDPFFNISDWSILQVEDLILKKDNSRVRVFASLAYDFNSKTVLHPESGDVFLENIDVSDLFKIETLDRTHNLALLIDYFDTSIIDHDEALEFISYLDEVEESDSDFDGMREVLESILGGVKDNLSDEQLMNMDDMLSSIIPTKVVRSKEERKLASFIEEALSNGDIEALKAVGAESLILYKNEQGGGAIHTACELNAHSTIELLHSLGLPFEVLDGDRFSVLDVCVDNESAESLELILNNHYADNLINSAFTISGFTPLHRAAMCGFIDIYEMLIKYGADDAVKNTGGMTAKEIRITVTG